MALVSSSCLLARPPGNAAQANPSFGRAPGIGPDAAALQDFEAPAGGVAAPFEHGFERLRIRAATPPRIQAKLVLGEAGDPSEREADAVAEQVMRLPDERHDDGTDMPPAPCCGGACAGECGRTLRRQLSSPFSIDEGVVEEGEDVGEAAAVQAKAAAGGRAAIGPGVAGRIQAQRAGGESLAAPVRAFMERRFGHDFGKVRVHAGQAASELAARVNARAFTLGGDVFFGAGQFAPESTAGRRLIAHELTHVVQQGHAPSQDATPSARPAPAQTPTISWIEREPGRIRRVKWYPNKATGRTSYPWGSPGPHGTILEGATDGGTALDIWRPDDGTTYWCHGYTFGGSTAKRGPYSIWGSDVPTVLKDDGWQETYSCMAQAADILVFWDSRGILTHSGIIRKASAPGARVDDAASTLESKWGNGSHNTSTWADNAKQYGRYRCYSKAPLTGVCDGKGANER